MLGRIALLILIGHPLSAWKVRLVKTTNQDSVHGHITNRAVDLVAHLDGNRNAVAWNAARQGLWDHSSLFKGDGDSHGNVLVLDEHQADEGTSTEERDLLSNAMNYNGGPYYRHWTRMLEHHGQVDGHVPEGMRRFKGQERQGVEKVYQYMAHMMHLVQDNCSPTHAANIRHAYYDGVEWYHWASSSKAGLGGDGRSIPKDVSALGPDVDSHLQQSWGQDFWGWNQKMKYGVDKILDRGKKNPKSEDTDKRNPLRKSVDKLLETVIQDTQRWMVDLKDLSQRDPSRHAAYLKMFKPLDEGGRRPSEPQIEAIWHYEGMNNDETQASRRLKPYPDVTSDEGFLTALDIQGRNHLFKMHQLMGPNSAIEQFKASPNAPVKPPSQVPFAPYAITAEGLIVAAQDKDIPYFHLAEKDQKVQGKWLEFHRYSTPWLPNPKYQGGAFDTNWGSYGGYWGFPGRYPFGGTLLQAGYDFFRDGDAPITPGDLYLMHDGEPNFIPYLPEWKRPGIYNWGGGFKDERDYTSVKPLSATLAMIGEQQIDRAAVWSAVCLETVSKALPPVLQNFVVTPRDPRLEKIQMTDSLRKLYEKAPLFSRYGAIFELTADLQRKDKVRVEFYAIPRTQFENPSTWKRPLTTAGAGVHSGTQPSQFEVWTSDLNFPKRYDMIYLDLPVFPLRVRKASSTISDPLLGWSPTKEFQVTTPAGEEDFKPMAMEATPRGDTLGYSYFASGQFIWTGEVGDPVRLSGDPLDTKAALVKAHTLPSGMPTKSTVLKQGDYFIFALVYYEGRREAFAQNQFKLLRPFQKAEDYAWWKEDALKWFGWAGWSGASVLGEQQKVPIPDELHLIRMDSEPMKSLKQ